MLKYSVVVTYCCERKIELEELLESISNQTQKADEIIVVTDGRAPELYNLSIILVEHEKCGRPAPLRNAGIKKAKNKYIFISDDDDIWHFQKAERQLKCVMQTNSKLCFTRKIDFSTKKLSVKRRGFGSEIMYEKITFRRLLFKNPLVLSSCLLCIDTESEKEKYFFCESTEVRGWADYHTWLSHGKRGNLITVVKEELLFYRVHPGSMRNGNIISMLNAQRDIITNDFDLKVLEKLALTILVGIRKLKWGMLSKAYFE